MHGQQNIGFKETGSEDVDLFALAQVREKSEVL
jgi:hypothetical protein